jgi:hypothetical protein
VAIVVENNNCPLTLEHEPTSWFRLGAFFREMFLRFNCRQPSQLHHPILLLISLHTLLSGAATRIPAKASTGNANMIPRIGITMKPANAIKSAKGSKMNPSVLLDIFSR